LNFRYSNGVFGCTETFELLECLKPSKSIIFSSPCMVAPAPDPCTQHCSIGIQFAFWKVWHCGRIFGGLAMAFEGFQAATL